ncbi:MetQ/NlpA family ABC transporter substrate-binding protein [Acinetobacter stercoris]|uniref:Lipoprotein n=1 Tax=Acinetobacter stercoris TaxID=2126983 RepID=A0A2U3MX60_9GAMM|nr:MetQ/NlpA family ABC transporter substrate-binding protein [Acinetobacter stercoris]SPL70022.1 Lipoprotein 28 precursor [Acinetobacter stercoris]
MYIFKKILMLFLVFILVACANQNENKHNEKTLKQKTKHIVLGSMGADADIWRFIAKSQAAQDAGLDIEVKNITDGIALNLATAEKKIDVNAFQSWAYLKTFNQKHGDSLRAIATTYLEPMGLYSKKYKDLRQLPLKAVIAIPNDTANTSRALLLLEQAELIKLKDSFDHVTGSVQDIISNPKQFQIKQVQGATTPRVLTDVDLAAIGNTNALESGLNVLEDALVYEKTNSKTMNNINILVVSKDRENDIELQKLATLYHQPEVIDYIKKHFGGTKLDVNQEISSLN